MDKNEYRLKTEQMLTFMKEKSYKEAMEIAEEIDWNRVKNTAMLCTVSEVYECNGEFQKSRNILFLAYDRAPESRKIIYRLGTLALKLGEVKEAMDCYDEFIGVAPKDPNRFILKYKILKAQKAPLEEQIACLQEFKKIEYVEKWSYELAKLYEEAGKMTECIEECDDLGLWFSEGKYVQRALELKMKYKPLTPLQQEKYRALCGKQVPAEEPVVAEEVTEAVAEAEKVTEEVAVAKEVAEVVAKEVVKVTELVAEEAVERPESVEEEVVEVTEEPTEEPEVEENAELVVEEVKEAATPSLSIAEILQDWEEKQKENAEIIRAKVEEAAEELQAQEARESEQEVQSILPDDIRQLMEELETESAEIETKRLNTQEVISDAKDKVVTAETVKFELIHQEKEQVQEEPTVEVQELFEDRQLEDVVKASIAAMEEVTQMKEENKTEIKLGDTQTIAISAKALIDDVEHDTREIEEPEKERSIYDTGFIVQGRYDLEAQSAIGLKAGLTEEQKKLFSYFVPVRGMSEQLVEVLHKDKNCKSRYGTSRIGNLVIVGRKGCGKTVLAVSVVKAIQKARRLKQGKVGIVTADSLNKKNVKEILGKLNGGALIIERASKLERKTIEELCEVMEGQTGEMLVVLEDARKPLDKFLAEYPQFRKKFTSRLEVPVFINDELVTFGQTYAKENGYKIDEMGILALYSKIDMLQREEKIVTVSDVKEILDDAIENTHRMSLKKLFRKFFGKTTDESDRILLGEEDFK